ncbi:MAG: serine/threonine protein kinase, partial [Chloroflexi bacterium]|nr:serine/threonine protein kinase [Chloroflexota bacterium]
MIALGPGATFGKYRILRVVGRGGMGLVYLAEDQDLCRQIALKVLHRGFAADEDFIHRFRQEARTIAGLKHPNIVPVHALDLIGDDLAIAMDFIEGGTLAGSKLSLQEALRYLGDILEALAWCHDKGIVHRDVKPNNILISPLGNALLSDFGLAKLLADFHASSVVTWASSGLFVGTPMYAPPEAWEGAEPTAAWDLYSVGTVLFEAIAGRLPYDAQTPLALIKQMIERPAPRLAELAPDISPELGELVDGLLRPDPLARP